MGFRLDAYSRAELRRIALPGNAPTTLFWVLPLGRWGPGELDEWWEVFTRREGICRDLGLLLIRNGPGPSSGEAADLDAAPLGREGARLSDLVPEATRGDGGGDRHHQEVLVLSGAYPQPGWGVAVSLKSAAFAPIAEAAVSEVGGAAAVGPILEAQRAYMVRKSVEDGRPTAGPQIRPAAPLGQEAQALRTLIDTESTDWAGLRRSLDRVLTFFPATDRRVAADLREWIALGTDLSRWPTDGDADATRLVAEFDALGDADRQAALAESRPVGERAFLRRLGFLRRTWPGWTPDRVSHWLVAEFSPHVRNCIREAFRDQNDTIERQLSDAEGERDRAARAYERDLSVWRDRLRECETLYRASIGPASSALWSLGPRFLSAMERLAKERGATGRSVAWDPVRMIGWKLKTRVPTLSTSDIWLAAKSVLGPEGSQPGGPRPDAEFDGSLFADHAYFVAMSADRMSPWDATRRLVAELLRPGELAGLVGPLGISGESTKAALSATLLGQWGWPAPRSHLPRPLIGCITTAPNGSTQLARSLGECRVSLESFLKDLVLVTLGQLGWNGPDAERRILDLCPSYRRSTVGAWTSELERLTGGAALVLLDALFPLVSPAEVATSAATLRAAREVLAAANEGAHDPPPPPLTDADRLRLGTAVVAAVAGAERLVGDMPWHFRATQVFGTSPAIATGYAWSHSHPEERLIRVILADGEAGSSEILVWNRSRMNPVMTDATVLWPARVHQG